MNRYLEIFADIEKSILDGTYPAGKLLPSENQLVKLYGVSRETIRKALALLLENGYIQKKQGKGSIVLDVNLFDFPISGLTSYKELQEAQHIPSKTIVSELDKSVLTDQEAAAIDFPQKNEVWKIVRQREIRGEVIILDIDYLMTTFVPNMTIEIAEHSIYDYLEKELHLAISYAQKEITVEKVTEQDQRLMTLTPDDTHVVVIRSLVYLEDTSLFQYTESRHRMDKFRFVDFARRRKI